MDEAAGRSGEFSQLARFNIQDSIGFDLAVKKKKRGSTAQKRQLPGEGFEKAVARIQQMMDRNSVVTHNEVLEDRVGNKRQVDVVIRGQFGGRSVIGVMECKDHSRKKGPDVVEAFAKKTEHLGANLRVIVSRRGFTKQALRLAKHENIGCLSLLPGDREQLGFSIGDMWYGLSHKWVLKRLTIKTASSVPPLPKFDPQSVKWQGKQVLKWFIKELLTTYNDEPKNGDHTLTLTLTEPRLFEIDGSEWPVVELSAIAERITAKKRQWVSWSGDGLYDWQTGRFTIPPGGVLVGSAVESDLAAWPEYGGEIPDITAQGKGLIRAIVYNKQKWDSNDDPDVPDLKSL